MLDEAHAAHVGGEIVHLHRAFRGADGVLLLAEVHGETLDARHSLVPLAQRLAVDGANPLESKVVEMARQCSRYEAARAGNEDKIIRIELPLDPDFCVFSHWLVQDACPDWSL